MPGHRQDDQDLLRRVGRRGQRVRGEDGEPDGLADRLVRRVGRRQRAGRSARSASWSGAGRSTRAASARPTRPAGRTRSELIVSSSFGFSLQSTLQPVADARLGQEMRGRAGIVLELVAQLRHVDAQVLACRSSAFGPPHLAQQLAVREHLARVLGERGERRYSVRVSRTSSPRRWTTRARQVDAQVAGLDDGLLRSRRPATSGAAPRACGRAARSVPKGLVR